MKNIVLTGFMATGKTAVGRIVSQRLGRPFVDMDAVIEERAHKSIPEIFAEDGELAFRQLESSLCHELSQQEGLIIATGGGALVDPINRQAFEQNSLVICLTCDPAEILSRVLKSGKNDRPLLMVENPLEQIHRLIEERRPSYTSIPYQIDTTRLTIEETAERVLSLSLVIPISVRFPGGDYLIHIGHGLLSHIGGLIEQSGCPVRSKIAIVTNPVVGKLYADVIGQSLRQRGYQFFVCHIPEGEQHKTLTTLSKLLDQFLDHGLDRHDTILALGGGVTGDLAGFAAAIYLRGVRLIQVPTTLLSMVDASVGGKTAVDLPRGKNLVGAFKQPALVAMDPSVLATLPVAEMRSGMAEVIKHSIIGNPQLFSNLAAFPGKLEEWWQNERGTKWLEQTVRVKIEIVEQDPYEKDRRAVLNLGHTIGHALEQVSRYTLRHGEAVSIGIVGATRLAHEMGLAQAQLVDQIQELLRAWGLPVSLPPYPTEAIFKAMALDKKRQGKSLRWVLPRSIGQVEIRDDVPIGIVESILKDMASPGGS